ncbi:MAG: Holliday junction branch migration protein RuvA [Lachnospiraceae bacterium]
MYSYIKGELVELSENAIVVEANNIGYNIRIPASLIDTFTKIGQEVKIYTYLYVKEDAMHLYGFLTRDDLKVFKLLLGVNGIGPKGALAVLSVLTPDDLRFAVLGEDAKTIAKAPGIGNKTAQRMIIELKDKLSLTDTFAAKSDLSANESVTGITGTKNEAIQALTALGYSSAEALKTLSTIEILPEMTVEEMLKEALKKMSFL